ncbi:MAG: stage sporulation protein [Bacillales bacterium]|jgi:stage V sporulation protein R|nr:stage sporulation protein [Bacillales bacterium]
MDLKNSKVCCWIFSVGLYGEVMVLTDIRHQLAKAIDEITEIAKGFGLDFYSMRYEICPADIIYTFGAYGMPTRFSHWSFGKQFYKMKLHYDFGLSKIYELVINSDPCYAFLLDGNSLIQNKLIVAHVLAHCDFFKNNVRFRNTKRDMVESMAASAERIRAYEVKYGREVVEKTIDAILAIEEHIDHSLIKIENDAKQESDKIVIKKGTPYDDLWDKDELFSNEKKQSLSMNKRKSFPEHPEKDVVLFILQNSQYLEEWQRDIMTMIRDEMLYFWPQLETKIMNEGWATYWHQQILREMDLTSDEALEFAKLNATVVQSSKVTINPYYFGLKMFEDIEERYNSPDKKMRERGIQPSSGRAKIFEVREIESDASFIRNYLSKNLVLSEDMYLFQRQGRDYKIIDKNWENIRDKLVSLRVNGGFPTIYVTDGDYLRNGELYLKHAYEGVELDIKYLEKVLPFIHYLWGRVVHLETVCDGKPVLFSYFAHGVNRKNL